MAIQYLSGNRATGTASDRAGLTTYSTKSWVELGRYTATSNTDTLTVSSLSTANYPYLVVLTHTIKNGTIEPLLQFNSDTGSNYSRRYTANGSGNSTNINQAGIETTYEGVSPTAFKILHISNVANQEKLIYLEDCEENTAGEGNTPNRIEVAGKWANTSDQITSVSLDHNSSGNFATGSELVVLGVKSSGTDTSKAGFWQELADLELSSAGDTLDTSTITAKKYLWIQAFIPEGAGHHGYIYFNNDTGSNYARRGSINGGSDITTTDDDEINWSHDTNSAKYLNMFVINKSDKEKLCIAEYMDYGSSGAGNAPNRIEWVYKWANTSAQITSVKLYNNQASSNDFPIGTTLKVWGSD